MIKYIYNQPFFNMIGLISILCLYIVYEFYTNKLTMGNIFPLITICFLRLYGKELYNICDTFIQNNIWTFLLLFCAISICAIRK
jgi:hypothetical protein